MDNNTAWLKAELFSLKREAAHQIAESTRRWTYYYDLLITNTAADKVQEAFEQAKLWQSIAGGKLAALERCRQMYIEAFGALP